MKKIKRVLFLILALTFVFCLNSVFITKAYNARSLFGSFRQKMDRAESLRDENKFIILGGSAANLAFDSQLFETLSGRPAVNLAVSADVPLRVYMQAAESCVKPGDVILMPLEYGYYTKPFYGVNETYVDIVSVDPALKCPETPLGHVEYGYTCFLRSFTRLNDCLLFRMKDAIQPEQNIYTADSVNAYGDFCKHEGLESTYRREISHSIFTYDIETIHHMLSFMDAMEAKGVQVYLTFPVFDMHSINDYELFCTEMQKMLDAYFPADRIIGTPMDFAHDADFFFDTTYHVKYENRKLYTEDLFRHYQATMEQNTLSQSQ